jgi:hypothetical protein
MRQMRLSQYLLIVALMTGVTIPSVHSTAEAISIAQSTSDFDKYMRLGYQATARRDYRNALVFFTKANGIKPSNPYANQALANVNRYINSKKRSATWISVDSGAPTNRSSGATRGHSCSKNGCLTALQPDNTDGKLTTLADYPEILFYVNKTTAPEMRFRLRDSVEGKNYTTKDIPIPKTDSMIKVDLSKLKDSDGKALPPLKVGREYLWSFEIMNDAIDRSNNPVLKGVILRQELDPSLAEMISKASPAERISIYAFNNVWYDFVSLLYQEKLAQPRNQELADKWNGLLEELNLSSIVKN